MNKVLFLILILPMFLSAQIEKQFDSLNRLLSISEQEEKAYVYNQLSKFHKGKDNGKALEYANQAYDLSKQFDDRENEAEALYNIAIAYFYSGNFADTKSNFIECIEIFDELNNSARKARAIQNLGIIAIYESDFNKATEYFTDATKVNNIEEHPDLLAEILMNLGANYYRLGDLNLALQTYSKSSILLKQEKVENFRRLTNRIGMVYWGKGDYDKATEYLLESVKLNKASNDTVGWSASCLNLGSVYRENRDDKLALEYFEKVVELSNLTNNRRELAKAFSNIGSIYNDQENFDKALSNYREAEKICIEINEQFTLSTVRNNIGTIYQERGDLNKALEYYSKAFEFKKATGNKEGTIMGYYTIGGIYQLQGNYKTALQYYNNALNIALEAQMKDRLTDIYEDLAEINADLKNYKLAYENHLLYSLYNDSVFNETKSQQIADLQTKYETEKKENENLKLRSENKIKNLTISRKNIIIYSLVSGVIVVLLLLTLLYLQYRQKDKAYKALVRQNLEAAKLDLIEKENDKHQKQQTGILDNEKGDPQTKLMADLLQYFKDEKPYFDSKLNLDDLCRALNTNRSYLSKVFNENLNKSFYEVLNEYRIKEARLLLIDPKYKHISIEGIGQTVGFASRSTFYSHFSKQFGISPTYFRKSIEQ